VHTVDFERVLATPTRSRSAHFAVHHVDSEPTAHVWRPKKATGVELSTDSAAIGTLPVDELPRGHWLGAVVPKRHARRSVTRSLLKRQIRAALMRHLDRLPAGLWLVRLRSPFSVKQFPSAASGALRLAAVTELEGLLSHAGR
jgi:ribonuclease P protein component